ncbi:MAG: hypothetical protein WCG20_01270 [bacterium]
MKYSTWIIVLSIVNIITIFSGFPTGTKRGIIVATTLIFIFIGLILRAIEKKQAARIKQKKQVIEQTYDHSLDQVAKAIAEDIHEQVEEEIKEITHQEAITHHDKETIS